MKFRSVDDYIEFTKRHKHSSLRFHSVNKERTVSWKLTRDDHGVSNIPAVYFGKDEYGDETLHFEDKLRVWLSNNYQYLRGMRKRRKRV